MKRAELLEGLADKSILIWGFGREGMSTYRFLRKYFPQKPLTIADSSPVDASGLTGVSLLQAPGWTSDFEAFDLVVKSPGITTYNQPVLREKITSQTELFLQCFRDQTVGITGTKGKSTTASLLAHQLNGCGFTAHLVGNIGKPCLDYFDEIAEGDIVVFELSCHQLEYLSASPHIAVLLNLYEEHLDHYGSCEGYFRAKQNIFRFQQPGDILVENLETQAPFAGVRQADVVTASLEGRADIYVEGSTLHAGGESLEVLPQDTQLLGRHNLYNIAIVYYLCSSVYHITGADFKRVLKSFYGLRHRLQRVGVYGGVEYYDDSISTVPATTIQALESLPGTQTLILGGMERNIDYTPLIEYLLTSGVQTLVLMPDTGPRIYGMLRSADEAFAGQRCVQVSGLKEAVQAAKQRTPQGGICLLSPAAASYGFYKNFEERGDRYQELVQQ